MTISSGDQMWSVAATLPANGQDWANYIAGYWSSDVYIKAVLRFEGELDITRMVRAVRLTIEAEPILGCYFVEGQPPYWQRYDNVNVVDWCTFQEADDSDQATREFLTTDVAPHSQQLHVKIIRTRQVDVLCVKLNHACSDAGGLKEYLGLLAHVYNELEADANYRPMPNSGSRDTSGVFRVLGITDPRTAYRPKQNTILPECSFPSYGVAIDLRVATLTIGPTQYMNVRSYAKQHGVTLNDMILSAYYRAMFSMVSVETDSIDIHVTVDLRRYLKGKKAEAVCNLSGIIDTRLSAFAGECFHETLDRVASMMKQHKAEKPGLHSAASMELMRHMPYADVVSFLRESWRRAVETGKVAPLLSNLGTIPPDLLQFSTHKVVEAFLVTPAMQPPGFMLGVSSYNNQMTFCVGYYSPATRETDVMQLLERIRAELTVGLANSSSRQAQ